MAKDRRPPLNAYEHSLAPSSGPFIRPCFCEFHFLRLAGNDPYKSDPGKARLDGGIANTKWEISQIRSVTYPLFWCEYMYMYCMYVHMYLGIFYV